MSDQDDTAHDADAAGDEMPASEVTAEADAGASSEVPPDAAPALASDAAAPDDGLTPRERRQLRQRKRRERRIWTGLAVAGVVVLGAFLFLFWPVMAGRLAAAKQLDQAQALLGQAKDPVAVIDKLVSQQLSPEASSGVQDTATQILVARRELNQVVALVDSAMPHLTEDEQKRAELIRTAAKARLVMVDRAPAILAASLKAVASKSLGDQAWALSTVASADETRAVRGYSLQTASGVQTAAVAVERIRGGLADAKALYDRAAAAFPSAAFARYAAYTTARLKAVGVLKQAAATWLAGNKPLAALDFSAYKTARTKADSIPKGLPPAQAASGQAFRQVAGKVADAYAKAKQQAIDAEKALGL